MSTLEFVGNYPSDAVPSELAWREHLDIGPRNYQQNVRGYAVHVQPSQRVIAEREAVYRNGLLQGPATAFFQNTNWVMPTSILEAVTKPQVQRIPDAPQGTGDENSLQPFLTGALADYIKQDTSFITTSGTWQWTAPGGFMPPARPIAVRWYNWYVQVLYDQFLDNPAQPSYLFGDPAYPVSTTSRTLVADIVCTLRPVSVVIWPGGSETFTQYGANTYTKIGPNLWRCVWQSTVVGSRNWPTTAKLAVVPAVGDTVGTIDLYRSFRTTRPPITGMMLIEPSGGPAPLDAAATVYLNAGAIAPLTYDWDVPGADNPTDNDNPHEMEFNLEGTWPVLVTVTDRSLRWTQFSADVVTSGLLPTALLESAAEASSATSVRVSALPPLAPEAMMGSLRLTPTLAQAPPKVEDRSWLTRPRVEED